MLEKDDTEYRTAPDNESSDKDEEEASVQKKMKKKKFKWEATVLAVLQSKGEMSLKKLRKKVSTEQLTCISGLLVLFVCVYTVC